LPSTQKPRVMWRNKVETRGLKKP